MILYDALGPSQRSIIGDLGPRMDVTNVADYYYHHDKEYWKIGEDFPCCRPPFDTLWVEYRYPNTMYSKEVGLTNTSVADLGVTAYAGFFISNKYEFTPSGNVNRLGYEGLIIKKDSTDRGQWSVHGGIWYVDRSTGKASKFAEPTGLRFDLDEHGNVGNFFMPSYMGKDVDEMASRAYLVHPILMAFSFANCKNIEIVQVKPPERLNRRRIERGKVPLSTYSIVNVLPFGKIYSRQTRTVSSGEGISVAIRRGGYAKYGPEYGRGKLFGKYSGMFWKPQVIATKKAVDHDYVVKVKG